MTVVPLLRRDPDVALAMAPAQRALLHGEQQDELTARHAAAEANTQDVASPARVFEGSDGPLLRDGE